MPALDSHHRYRAFRSYHFCGAKGRAHEPCSYWCCCRSHCRWRKRDGLRASLHRRFIAVRCGLVRRHDCALHVGRRSIRAAVVEVVTFRVRTGRMHRFSDSTESEKSWLAGSLYGVDHLSLPSGKAVTVARYRFDRRGEGTELLPQRTDYRLDFIRAREGGIPDLGKHLIAGHDVSIRTEQRPHHTVLQPRGWLVPAVQDEFTTGLVEPAASRRQGRGRERLRASKERMHHVGDRVAVDPRQVHIAIQ